MLYFFNSNSILPWYVDWEREKILSKVTQTLPNDLHNLQSFVTEQNFDAFSFRNHFAII